MREKIWDTLDDKEKKAVNDAYYNRRKLGKFSARNTAEQLKKEKGSSLDFSTFIQ